MNLFSITGTVDRIDVSNKEKPSALLILRYGPIKVINPPTSQQFINSIPVRVPHFLWEKFATQIEKGAVITVYGRLQGIMKSEVITVEIVAERMAIENEVPSHG